MPPATAPAAPIVPERAATFHGAFGTLILWSSTKPRVPRLWLATPTGPVVLPGPGPGGLRTLLAARMPASPAGAVVADIIREQYTSILWTPADGIDATPLCAGRDPADHPLPPALDQGLHDVAAALFAELNVSALVQFARRLLGLPDDGAPGVVRHARYQAWYREQPWEAWAAVFGRLLVLARRTPEHLLSTDSALQFGGLYVRWLPHGEGYDRRPTMSTASRSHRAGAGVVLYPDEVDDVALVVRPSYSTESEAVALIAAAAGVPTVAGLPELPQVRLDGTEATFLPTLRVLCAPGLRIVDGGGRVLAAATEPFDAALRACDADMEHGDVALARCLTPRTVTVVGAALAAHGLDMSALAGLSVMPLDPDALEGALRSSPRYLLHAYQRLGESRGPWASWKAEELEVEDLTYATYFRVPMPAVVARGIDALRRDRDGDVARDIGFMVPEAERTAGERALLDAVGAARRAPDAWAGWLSTAVRHGFVAAPEVKTPTGLRTLEPVEVEEGPAEAVGVVGLPEPIFVRAPEGGWVLHPLGLAVASVLAASAGHAQYWHSRVRPAAEAFLARHAATRVSAPPSAWACLAEALGPAADDKLPAWLADVWDYKDVHAQDAPLSYVRALALARSRSGRPVELRRIVATSVNAGLRRYHRYAWAVYDAEVATLLGLVAWPVGGGATAGVTYQPFGDWSLEFGDRRDALEASRRSHVGSWLYDPYRYELLRDALSGEPIVVSRDDGDGPTEVPIPRTPDGRPDLAFCPRPAGARPLTAWDRHAHLPVHAVAGRIPDGCVYLASEDLLLTREEHVARKAERAAARATQARVARDADATTPATIVASLGASSAASAEAPAESMADPMADPVAEGVGAGVSTPDPQVTVEAAPEGRVVGANQGEEKSANLAAVLAALGAGPVPAPRRVPGGWEIVCLGCRKPFTARLRWLAYCEPTCNSTPRPARRRRSSGGTR